MSNGSCMCVVYNCSSLTLAEFSRPLSVSSCFLLNPCGLMLIARVSSLLCILPKPMETLLRILFAVKCYIKFSILDIPTVFLSSGIAYYLHRTSHLLHNLYFLQKGIHQ